MKVVWGLLVCAFCLTGCVEVKEGMSNAMSSLNNMAVAAKSTPTGGGKKPLTKDEITAKLAQGTLYRDTESFDFLPDGNLLYTDEDTGEAQHGSWYLRSSLVPHKKNRQDDMLCIAIGKSNADSFTWAPCMRLFPEDDNVYLASIADCKVSSVNKAGNVSCNYDDRTMAYYRIKRTQRK